MTGRIGVGAADGEDLERTEALLTRLGRREPSSTDLEDPLAAALVALAEEVDAQPVPVAVTRSALAVADTRPRRPRRGVSLALSAAGPGVRPRVLRLRSWLVFGAAGVLALLGGGTSVLVTAEGTSNPLTRLTSVVQEWAGDSSMQATHRRLADKVEVARAALDQGRPKEAARLIRDVRREFGSLDAGQQRRQADIAHEIAEIEGRLRVESPATGSVPPGSRGPDGTGAGASRESAASRSTATTTSGPAVTPPATPIRSASLSSTTPETPDDAGASILGEADGTEPCPTTSGPTTSGPTTSGPTTSGPTTSGPTTSGPTTSHPRKSHPAAGEPGRVPASEAPSSSTAPSPASSPGLSTGVATSAIPAG